MEGLRRDRFVEANLFDREGVTGPGNFVFKGTPASDVNLAAHHHASGGIDPELPALCRSSGAIRRRFIGDRDDVAAVFLAENFGGSDVLINLVEQQGVGMREVRSKEFREIREFGEGHAGVLRTWCDVPASEHSVEMLAVDDLGGAEFA